MADSRIMLDSRRRNVDSGSGFMDLRSQLRPGRECAVTASQHYSQTTWPRQKNDATPCGSFFHGIRNCCGSPIFWQHSPRHPMRFLGKRDLRSSLWVNTVSERRYNSGRSEFARVTSIACFLDTNRTVSQYRRSAVAVMQVWAGCAVSMKMQFCPSCHAGDACWAT